MKPPVDGFRAGRILAAGLILALAGGGFDAAGTPVRGDRESGALTRLAGSLLAEDPGVQADFAAIAVGEVIRVHELELDRLSVPGQVSRREIAKQYRWARALEAFLDDLYLARDELDQGVPVELVVAPPAPVQLLVGERLVELSSPRIENPTSLESDIVALFCEGFPCDLAVLEPPEPPPQRPVGGWSFRAGMGSTFETPDGLGFMFTDVRRRSEKEAACRKVHAELNRLADALAREQRRGRRVDFEVLSLESPGRGDNQRIVTTRSGSRMRMDLPVLARAPAVVEVAREWLRARAEGRSHRQLFPRSDLLLAELLGRG